MSDILIKALARSGNVRVLFTDTTELVEESRIKHNTWPTATAALGRTLSVASMMASMFKDEDEQLTIRINGGGPIGTILVKAYGDLRVKGFVGDGEIMLINNNTGKLNVGAAVGRNGQLRVSKDLNLKQDFTGVVDLISGEIGEDFAYYFNDSEQTPSYVSVGVLVGEEGEVVTAGGLIIQMMPDASEEDIVFVEELASRLKPVSTLIQENKDFKELLKELFPDIQVLGEYHPYFSCDCSKEKIAAAIKTLGSEEINRMINEDHGCEAHCEFCNTYYQFSAQELKEINK